MNGFGILLLLFFVEFLKFYLLVSKKFIIITRLRTCKFSIVGFELQTLKVKELKTETIKTR